MIDPQLDQKVVLITGANHGIGAVTARLFAQQGAHVFVSYYRVPCSYTEGELTQALEAGIPGERLYRAMQQQPIEPLLEELREKGTHCSGLELDLSDPANIPALFDRCETELGPVDILVNNHTHCVLETFDPGLVTDKDFSVQLISTAGIDAHFAVNTRSFALMMSEFFKRALLRNAGWGRIINISTDAAHAHPRNISYAASKHAIESYSRSAAVEMGPYGITVNILAPGPIQTGYLSPEAQAEVVASTPLGHVGLPEDVAEVIILLASEQAHWVTGQLLYVGGGYRMSQ